MYGDYIENPTGDNIKGQMLLGFMPRGIVGDVRDSSHGFKECTGGKGCENFMLSLVGFIPGGGDLVKGLIKEKNLAKEVVSEATVIPKAIETTTEQATTKPGPLADKIGKFLQDTMNPFKGMGPEYATLGGGYTPSPAGRQITNEGEKGATWFGGLFGNGKKNDNKVGGTSQSPRGGSYEPRPAAARNLLRKNLGPPPAAYNGKAQAHHIVPLELIQKNPDIKEKFETFGIDRNDVDNGIRLPTERIPNLNPHPTLHSGRTSSTYLQNVFNRLNKLSTKDKFLEELYKIKSELYKGEININNVQ